ncbi:MAG: dTDP-4-dehydrorhamnose reductase [Armatimonadetes bacterium]|nr:dTDP-4-dehydrorhamnose reductase [Armatimonadota bacterium]
MRVLVIGAGGMLGKDTMQALSGRHTPLSAVYTGGEGYQCDITDTRAVQTMIRELGPDAVVLSAAYTDVDGCESDPEKAYRVNALGPWNVASACAAEDIPLAYISSDFVFDGEKGEPYTEWDAPNPLGHYGRSKWMGERHIAALCHRYFIIRTAWLFGTGGKCFPRTILRAARTRPELKVVCDQTGSPTYTPDLAKVIVHLLETPLYGIYHAANAGQCSWHEFACKTLEMAGLQAVPVRPIPSSEWPTPTRRPACSVLRSFHLELTGHPPFRPWEAALADFVRAVLKEEG